MKTRSWIVAVALMAWGLSLEADPPRNVLILIGDGMGFQHVDAARYYAGVPMSFEALPYQADCTTYSANSSVTDSAAAATAIATGVKVDNNVVSVAIPGDGLPLETLLESSQLAGQAVGLVTTTYLTHATPAAFGAHENNRGNYSQIAGDYLNGSVPNVLFGGGGNGLSVSASQTAGYTVATDTAGFQGLDTSGALLSAQFGTTHLPYEYDYVSGTYPYPHLEDMVLTAIDALDDDPDGFFLMIEGGRIDHAAHDNNTRRMIHEVLAFSDAVQVALDWAAARDDTLIIVTADHETGGISGVTNNGSGVYPTVNWTSTGHSGVPVPVYAWGVNAELVTGTLDNTDFVGICTADLYTPQASAPQPPNGAAQVAVDVTLSWKEGTGAESHELYLWEGASPPGTPTATLAAATTSWTPPQVLLYETTYSWRVDEVSDGGGTLTPGNVWTFTTVPTPAPPGPATDLEPEDGATGVAIDADLSWTAGTQALEHDVYFGTSDPPDYQGTQTTTTFNPGTLEYATTYFWRVDEVNTVAITAGATSTFTTAAEPVPDTWLAVSEQTHKGTLLAEDYTATHVSDDLYETFQEEVSVPNKNGYSTLDHVWTFQLDGASAAEFYVEAFHTPSNDGDHFIFSYSEDGELFTTMLTVEVTSDPGAPQHYGFPGGLADTVYIRVTDTDHSKGAQDLDTLYVDSMSIVTATGSIVHYAASQPSPLSGAEGVSLTPSLSWKAGEEVIRHHVYFGPDWEEFGGPSSFDHVPGQIPTYEPGSLDPLTTYYWQVTEERSGGILAEGPVWLFTTLDNSPCNPAVFEVQSVVTTTERGSQGQSFGVATVTVVNECGDPGANVLVEGYFTGDFTDDFTGPNGKLTNADGVVVFKTSTEVKKPSFGFVPTAP